MKTYAAGRQMGKTMLCISKAASFVRNGLEVYYICPTAQMCDFVKMQTLKYEGKTVADAIHFMPASKIFNSSHLSGANKRKSSKIIFDDGDLSLSNLVREKFGAYAEIELFTATSDWRDKEGKR